MQLRLGGTRRLLPAGASLPAARGRRAGCADGKAQIQPRQATRASRRIAASCIHDALVQIVVLAAPAVHAVVQRKVKLSRGDGPSSSLHRAPTTKSPPPLRY